jgi:hypothetical protein
VSVGAHVIGKSKLKTHSLEWFYGDETMNEESCSSSSHAIFIVGSSFFVVLVAFIWTIFLLVWVS